MKSVNFSNKSRSNCPLGRGSLVANPAASRPRHKPSRAGGGADWRIPLRIGPALDRRRVLAGSGTRHRRGGAARGFKPRRQYLGGLASPRSLSPEASSSMGGSTESGPIPSGGGGGSDASLGRSRATCR